MKVGHKLLIVAALVISGVLIFIAIKSSDTQTYVATNQIPVVQNNAVLDTNNIRNWDSSLANPSNAQASSTELTSTDTFSRELLQLYLTKTYQQGTIDAQTQQQITDQLLADVPKATFKSYTLSDISVSQNTDASSLKTYGNAVGKLFKDSKLPADASEPLATLQNALNNNDITGFDKLKSLHQDTDNMLASLLALKVPQPLASAHIDLINAVSSLSSDLQAMANASADPLSAIEYTNAYFTSIKNLGDALKEIATYFKQHNISFQQGEDGRVVMDTL